MAFLETLIEDPVTTAGNHRCMLPYGGRVPRGHGSIPFDHEGAPCADVTELVLGVAEAVPRVGPASRSRAPDTLVWRAVGHAIQHVTMTP
jgi:hypothetical protein